MKKEHFSYTTESLYIKMPYPQSPFADNFDLEVITHSKETYFKKPVPDSDLKQTLEWLCSWPKLTSYRVNTLKVQREVVAIHIQQQLDKILANEVFRVEFNNFFDNVIIIRHHNTDSMTFHKHLSEIIVDVDCAAAVLRGAHIYAPGVLGMLSGTKEGDHVSIYADVSKICKKGLLKLYQDKNKVFIGNGIVCMTRHKLFGTNLSPGGIAVEVSEVVSGCPAIGNDFLPAGWAMLQNIPSIVCTEVLNPQQNEIILDMCAAPGNKTTHIASLMSNKGIIIAIDKTPSKVAQLRKTCYDFEASVSIYQADSCKLVGDTDSNIQNGPPFAPNTFDRILLDAPCSVLGKRPQFYNKSSEKSIQSYVPLQRKLFTNAVALLKPRGILVYSTCTITLAENEGMVAWALKTFSCLELVKPNYNFGSHGWPGTSLSDENRCKVQRFGPGLEFDSVGFFIACFTKK